MKELRKWAKDKPDIIKIFAAHLVSTVQGMAEEFKTIKLRRFASQKFSPPHLPSWFAMYRSHRKTVQQVKDIWAAVFGRNIVDFFSGLSEEAKKKKRGNSISTQPTQNELDASVKFLQTMLSASEKELEDEFNNVSIKQAAKRRMSKLIEKNPLELGFYLFVAVPCWALYRMSPTALYRKARQGDFDALEKLLCLDQLMLHDPAIGKQIIDYRFKHSSSKYRKLLDAATKSPKGSDSSKNILLSQVGLISAISHLTTKPLTPQDLFELVHAFDQDSKNKLLDDLPENYDALARALSPDRNLWRQLLPSDKNM
ncbi:hypothetical protein [Geobacter sp. AOG1]|uniref:hypothetical protein n=1 Tax=Geobacter sp. AOG1 TaxID=1566346 RepID=UPI001CC62096|nr:hypothetical protein [Geobacter sp. AOG1]GFE58733.1 hypothetical protein AOG1_26130 [Geobacter sp. AOG1]